MLYRCLFLCGVLIATLAAPAISMVGDDIYSDRPDLFCPARVISVIPMHEQPSTEPDLGTDNVFAVKLMADTPKTVSGTLQVLSHDQPFKVAFSNVTLTASPYSVTNGKNVVRSGTAYYSAPVYFALPRAMPINAVWIYEIAVDGKPADCGTLPVYYLQNKTEELPLANHVGGVSAEDARRHAPQHPPLAAPEKSLDLSACPAPVKEGEPVYLKQPAYPQGVASRTTTVFVKLAIDAAGHLADVSVLQTSGELAFDAVALDSATQSRFNPRLFLCSSIPGFYIFRANFQRT